MAEEKKPSTRKKPTPKTTAPKEEVVKEEVVEKAPKTKKTGAGNKKANFTNRLKESLRSVNLPPTGCRLFV